VVLLGAGLLCCAGLTQAAATIVAVGRAGAVIVLPAEASRARASGRERSGNVLGRVGAFQEIGLEPAVAEAQDQNRGGLTARFDGEQIE
jgi:hypothetical protein